MFAGLVPCLVLSFALVCCSLAVVILWVILFCFVLFCWVTGCSVKRGTGRSCGVVVPVVTGFLYSYFHSYPLRQCHLVDGEVIVYDCVCVRVCIAIHTQKLQ